MLQGFTNIPSYFFQFLNHNLQAFQPPYSSTLILGGGGVVQLLSPVQLFSTPWTAACQASLSFTISQSLLKLLPIESMMPSNHLVLCCPLLLLSCIFPYIRVFSNESALCIKWPNYWSFSFSISPPNELFRTDFL